MTSKVQGAAWKVITIDKMKAPEVEQVLNDLAQDDSVISMTQISTFSGGSMLMVETWPEVEGGQSTDLAPEG